MAFTRYAAGATGKSKSAYTGPKKPWYKAPPPIEKVGRKAISPSIFQSAIFQRIVEMMRNRSMPNLMVRAVAGSGKTTTLVESLYNLIEELTSDIRVVFLAFNKKIATELESRIPVGFAASTLHSFGMKTLGRPRVEPNKVLNYLKATLAIQDGIVLDDDKNKENKLKWVLAFHVNRIVSLCKNKAILPSQITIDLIEELVEFYSLDCKVTEEITTLVKDALKVSNANRTTVDFDDMIYLPAILGLAPVGFDLVLVDEAQDLNESQLILLENMQKANPRLRFVFVGDESQAIYGFRGAGTDSMDIIKKRFGCEVLPLSVSYRCAKSIIAHAQEIVSEILACDTAPQGSVEFLPSPESVMQLCHDVKERLAVVCRTNAPLVPFAYSLMRAGLPVVIIGRDVAEGLCRLIDKISKDTNLPLMQFVSQLTNWADEEAAKFEGKNKPDRVEEIRDKEATLLAFSDGVVNVNGLKDKINDIYKDTTYDSSIVDKSIKLMTIHKSKGLEFEIVGILPTKPVSVENEWQVRQESNLKYVARTRAIMRLCYFPEKEKPKADSTKPKAKKLAIAA